MNTHSIKVSVSKYPFVLSQNNKTTYRVVYSLQQLVTDQQHGTGPGETDPIRSYLNIPPHDILDERVLLAAVFPAVNLPPQVRLVKKLMLGDVRQLSQCFDLTLDEETL